MPLSGNPFEAWMNYNPFLGYYSHNEIIFLNKKRNDHQMMTLQQIRHALSARMPIKVANATGLHYNTIRQVRDNATANPTHKVLKALSDYFESQAVSNG